MQEYKKKTLNKNLCSIATNYAQKLAKNNNFKHSNNKYNGEDLGENLFMCQGYEITGKNMTKSWYDEIKDYRYQNNFVPKAGHFSQVVWKGSKELGVGVAQAKNGTWYGVCNYFPAGNFQGEFLDNVLRP